MTRLIRGRVCSGWTTPFQRSGDGVEALLDDIASEVKAALPSDRPMFVRKVRRAIEVDGFMGFVEDLGLNPIRGVRWLHGYLEGFGTP